MTMLQHRSASFLVGAECHILPGPCGRSRRCRAASAGRRRRAGRQTCFFSGLASNSAPQSGAPPCCSLMGKQSKETPARSRLPQQQPGGPLGRRWPPATRPSGMLRDTETGIARQIYVVLERLGADQGLLGIIANWCDTLNDAELPLAAAGVQYARQGMASDAILTAVYPQRWRPGESGRTPRWSRHVRDCWSAAAVTWLGRSRRLPWRGTRACGTSGRRCSCQYPGGAGCSTADSSFAAPQNDSTLLLTQ